MVAVPPSSFSFPLPEACISTRASESLSQLLSLWKSTFHHLIGLCVIFVAPALESLLSQKKEAEEGGGWGVTNRTGDWPVLSCAALYSAAYLCTFCPQSLFRERNAINIFLLFPPFPSLFSSSAHNTLCSPSDSLLTHLFPPFPPLWTGLNSFPLSIYCLFVSASCC